MGLTQMTANLVEERMRVLFHLNGYSKVMVELTEGVGLADGGSCLGHPD